MCHYIMFVFDNIFITPSSSYVSTATVVEDDAEEEIKFCSEGNESHPGERGDKSIKLSADKYKNIAQKTSKYDSVKLSQNL